MVECASSDTGLALGQSLASLPKTASAASAVESGSRAARSKGQLCNERMQRDRIKTQQMVKNHQSNLNLWQKHLKHRADANLVAP